MVQIWKTVILNKELLLVFGDKILNVCYTYEIILSFLILKSDFVKSCEIQRILNLMTVTLELLNILQLLTATLEKYTVSSLQNEDIDFGFGCNSYKNVGHENYLNDFSFFF